MTIQKTVKVLNNEGLHARPASLLVQAAAQFKSDVFVCHEEMRLNAKSIMNIMSLCLAKDAEFTIEASGDDAQIAVDKLAELVDSGFGEL